MSMLSGAGLTVASGLLAPGHCAATVPLPGTTRSGILTAGGSGSSLNYSTVIPMFIPTVVPTPRPRGG